MKDFNYDDFRFGPPSEPSSQPDEFFLEIDDGGEDILIVENADGTTLENPEQERFLSWHQGRHVAIASIYSETAVKLWVIASSENIREFSEKISKVHPAVCNNAEIFFWNDEKKMHTQGS